MKHLDIIGLRGSGKSTVTQHIMENNTGVEFHSDSFKKSVVGGLDKVPYVDLYSITPNGFFLYLSKSGNKIRKKFNIPSKYVEYIRQIASKYTDNRDRIKIVKNWFQNTIYEYKYLQSVGIGTTIVPKNSLESLVQLSVAIFCPPNPSIEVHEQDIIEYVRKIPLPDEIIFLEVPVNVCDKRMKNRGKIYPELKYSSYGRDPVIKYLKRINNVLNIVSDEIKKSETDLIRISNNRPLRQTISDIYSKSELIYNCTNGSR